MSAALRTANFPASSSGASNKSTAHGFCADSDLYATVTPYILSKSSFNIIVFYIFRCESYAFAHDSTLLNAHMTPQVYCLSDYSSSHEYFIYVFILTRLFGYSYLHEYFIHIFILTRLFGYSSSQLHDALVLSSNGVNTSSVTANSDVTDPEPYILPSDPEILYRMEKSQLERLPLGMCAHAL